MENLFLTGSSIFFLNTVKTVIAIKFLKLCFGTKVFETKNVMLNKFSNFKQTEGAIQMSFCIIIVIFQLNS